MALFQEFQRKNMDPLKEVWLPQSDYNIGNMEFVIPNSRSKYFFDVSDEYKVDYDYFSSLALDKFDAYGLANNHIFDYGRNGVTDIIDELSKKEIAVFGLKKKEYDLLKFEIKGISFAIIGCVKNGRWISKDPYSPNEYDPIAIVEKIKDLKQKIDHVFVYPHIGTELVDVPKPEDVEILRGFIDAGATAVVGHHPHIVQGIEKYKKGIIAYSLGSFVYLPSFEVGYSKEQGDNRDFSFCLNMTFDKEQLIEHSVYNYKLDHKKLIPIQYQEENNYFDKLNTYIDDPSIYSSKVRNNLFKRELISFFQRLRKNPIKTIKHYAMYLKIKHLKMLLDRRG